MTEANDSDSGKGYYRRSEMRRLMSQPVETYRYEEESKRGDGDGAVTARPPVMRRFAAPVQRYANRISMPVLPQGNIHESSPDLQESKTRSGLMSDVELQQGFKYSSNLRETDPDFPGESFGSRVAERSRRISTSSHFSSCPPTVMVIANGGGSSDSVGDSDKLSMIYEPRHFHSGSPIQVD
ncbi:unnamed protein product [Notodromas monacha]|uniref:Uncharacterized protein n=1 Tax=Notodromas monacha TaxID=399045 RepID=A0A7R9BBS6_9CRUS|nr:unnamed protein product [Notodromas monacha]CAG0912345.1 unnamed protein product [Notodromas monacha]